MCAQTLGGSPLEEVIVLGEVPTRLTDLARSASVIDADALERASTTNITDVLARETGVNLLSFFGSDKFGGVDIRGMGAASTSNVLVLIDGMPINAPDLQGADYTSLPLESLDRIEIIRGAGSARFGDGAVGGVVNLITRPVTGDEPTRIKVGAGSFVSFERALSASHKIDDLAVQANVNLYNSEGYRENSQLEKKDFALRAAYRASDHVTTEVSLNHHTDQYGLPGPLPAAVLDAQNASARRATTSPNDGGETCDTRVNLRSQFAFDDAGTLNFGARYRNRSNPFLIGYNDQLSESEQAGSLDEETALGFLDHQADVAVAGHPVSLSLGGRFQATEYGRSENGVNILDRSSQQLGDFTDAAVFGALGTAFGAVQIDLAWRVARRDLSRESQRLIEVCDETIVIERIPVLVNIGGVDVPIPGQFVDVPVAAETNCRGELEISQRRDAVWTNSALDFGLLWQIQPKLVSYLNFATSFRNPNVDELTLSTPDLGPQRGQQVEVGLKYAWGGRFDAQLALFRMRTEDEILFSFDPLTARGANRNADEPVLRQGVELSLRAQPVTGVSASLNYALLDAHFEDSDARIPLTARHTLNGALRVAFTPTLSGELRARYVGNRLDGNDLPNGQFPALDPYTVMDLRIDYELPKARFFAGINNLGNSVYSTIAYSGRVYPMPERNFQLGVNIEI